MYLGLALKVALIVLRWRLIGDEAAQDTSDNHQDNI